MDSVLLQELICELGKCSIAEIEMVNEEWQRGLKERERPQSLIRFADELCKAVMRKKAEKEAKILGYMAVPFFNNPELECLYGAVCDYWRLYEEGGVKITASMFFNLGKMHGIREERAKRRRKTENRAKGRNCTDTAAFAGD